MVDANQTDAITQLFSYKKDRVIQFLLPVLPLEFKTAVPPLVNKKIRVSVVAKTRDV